MDPHQQQMSPLPMVAPLPGLCASSVAFHLELKAALSDPKFMRKGGVLGVGCQHVYPHTSEGLCDGIPALLKVGSIPLDSPVCMSSHLSHVPRSQSLPHPVTPTLNS